MEKKGSEQENEIWRLIQKNIEANYQTGQMV